MSDSETSSQPPHKPHPGDLPAWGQADLPQPLPWSVKNVIRTIGPGAILLAGSIGGGEWFVGPTLAVKHGTGIFWIATCAIVLQVLFNLESIRYTLYTGEPISTGIMRLKPGSKFWGTIYVLLTAAQLGVPALALGCSTVLFATFAGRMPVPGDSMTTLYICYGLILLVVAMLLFGGTIERMLEIASWAMIAFIFVFLCLVNVIFVPISVWGRTLTGFFQLGYLPEGVNMPLLATLAATAGAGGIGNLTISNWVRDKGMGMGAHVGAINSAVGSKHVRLSHVGKIFPITAENLSRWHIWWKYVLADQVWLWALGCFVGMYLNVNLAVAIMPRGEDISGIGAGAFQAKYMAEQLWSGFWFLGLMNGFWILFSTHLGNTDVLVRTVTDIVWVASKRARNWRGGDIAKIYYGLLVVFTIWGLFAVGWGTALDLFKVLGTVAGIVLAMGSIQVLRVNTRLLPPELRPGMARRTALVVCAIFYATFTAMAIWPTLRPMFED